MGRIGKNKNEIIDCAIKIMDKKGLSSFQLSDVAEAMEMKTPSLYNHFDGLDDLIRAVQLRTNQLLYEFMLESAQGLKTKKPSELFVVRIEIFSKNTPASTKR
jgi:AcrR family transcriptional regulator